MWDSLIDGRITHEKVIFNNNKNDPINIRLNKCLLLVYQYSYKFILIHFKGHYCTIFGLSFFRSGRLVSHQSQ